MQWPNPIPRAFKAFKVISLSDMTDSCGQLPLHGEMTCTAGNLRN